MDFVYYIVRKKDMVILDGAKDMVSAINIGQQQNCSCLILQACVITEIGQDLEESTLIDNSEFYPVDSNENDNAEYEEEFKTEEYVGEEDGVNYVE